MSAKKSDTPRTDAELCEFTPSENPEYDGPYTWVHALFARDLERENNSLRNELENASQDHQQADTDTIRALHERNELRQDVSILQEALGTLLNLHDGLAHGGEGITPEDWMKARKVLARTGKGAA